MLDHHRPDLSVIIVSWNVRELLRACLRSVVGGQESGVRSQGPERLSPVPCPLSLEIIVIDNASSDGSAAMVADEFPDVELIANSENFGFTRGNNQGLASAQGRYILFLNPDTVVAGDALRTMITYMDAHPQVGASGPRLFYADGTPQSSRRRFPTLATALFESTPLAWHWPDSLNPWARRYRMEEGQGLEGFEHREAQDRDPADPVASAAEEVDWLVGAALLVRREVLEQIGGFDEGYFMYSEELDWCRRAKGAGWHIVYLPSARIVHYEGKSSEQVTAARHIHFQTSKVRYFRKYHGPLVAGFLRLAILGMFAVEWLLEGSKWLLGSRRSLRRGRMAAYSQLLRSGLRSPR